MPNQAVVSFVAQYKSRIDGEIGVELKRRMREVSSISPHLTKIVSAMQELSVGGKRLRGLLTVLGYELAGGTVNDEVIKAGVVMELFHLGLLIQDDVMDQDSLRRGVKTINSRYADRRIGESVAMLAGDYTFGWGIECLSGLALDSELVKRSMRVWGKYFTRVGYGQTLDGLDIANDKTILRILAIKSGEYSCVLPLLLGATLGGGDKHLLMRLELYWMELGWVFQLRDDWLGMYGDSTKTGKPAGEQDRKGKRTFATLYGQAKTENAIAEHWEKGKKLAMGNKVLLGLLEWMATREN